MKEYTFTPETAKQLAKKQAFTRLPIIFLAIAGGLYISNHGKEESLFDNPKALMLIIPLLIITIIASVFRGIKKGKKSLLQFKYILTENSIKSILPTGSQEMEFSAIEKHFVQPKGLLLQGEKQKLFISNQIENYSELEQTLLNKLK